MTALPRTILVPVDFSDASRKALAYGVGLAEKLGSRIVVLHAYDLPIVGFPDGAYVATPEIATRISNAAQSALGDIVAQHAKTNVSLTALLRQGDAREVIHAVAAEVSADLICMGTHGRRGVARALLGSVTERVMRTSSVPVLTVHADSPSP